MTETNSRLNNTLASFARALVSDRDTTDLLYELCDVSLEAVDVTGSGILVEDVDGSLRYAVASDTMTAQLEGVQLETGEGPCMLSHSTAEPVLVPNLAAETRFPTFGTRALDGGVRAVFTFPMLRGDRAVGVLDFYRDRATGLTEEQIEHAKLLADMATAVVLNRRAYDEGVAVTEQLQTALDARIAMEQAKGRISEQADVSMDVAEKLIYDHARATGVSVGRVIREIAAGDVRMDQVEGETG